MKRLFTIFLTLASVGSQALEIVRFSPQGKVAQVQQVVVKFDEDVVNFGDPKAPAPMSLSCGDTPATQGTGRWTSEREWVFDFANELPAATACTLQVRPGLQSLKGTALKGRSRYTFQTGGLRVLSVQPDENTAIDEEQFFILQLNGPATLASVQASVGCQVEGLGERVAVRLIDGPERAAFLKSRGTRLAQAATQAPLNWATLACNRRLPSAGQVHLVVGPGLVIPGQSPVTSTSVQRFSYKVREPFEASFSCERQNAQSACLPVRPLRISFNAPISRKLAEGIRLTGPNTTLAPRFDADQGPGDVQGVAFPSVLPEQTQFTLTLPKDFKDSEGRELRNASSFPMAVATDTMPPLAKFGAAPFGVVERLAEPTGVALLPVTLRAIEGAQPGKTGGQVSTWQPTTDADIMAWFAKVQRYDNATVPRKTATSELKGLLPRALEAGDRDEVQTRMVSLLRGQPGVKTLDLPQSAGDIRGAKGERPFEVVGIPLSAGFHVVEIASSRLGSALLDPRHGDPRTMFVRTSALVTNLGVHFKLGRDNALAWVTTLDKGQPVTNARVRVSDCQGREVASASTNAQGIATFKGISPEAPSCAGDSHASQSYFVSARAMQHASDSAHGVEDLAFTWSNWHRGIEPWRFNLPTSQAARPDERAHTIFDRTLVRAGETVSMKHLLRTETAAGFALAPVLPTTLVITHLGSGQQSTQPLVWRKTATGGQSAESSFAVPQAAKLGVYEVELRGLERERSFTSGQFRVEEFRLPVLEGRISPTDKKPLVNVTALPLDVQVNYVAGGGAARLPVQVSALVQGKDLNFSDFEGFSFSPPRAAREDTRQNTPTEDDEPAHIQQDVRIIADKLPLTLDKLGAGKLTLSNIPPAPRARELLIEATYADPSGELQTLRSSHTLWPAAVVAGIKTEGWVSSGQKVSFQALALGLAGKPQAGVTLDVRAISRIVTSSRKRMVGGFYTYDNSTTVKDLGSVCSGKSDARGLLLCDTTLRETGEVELVVTARDAAGNRSQAASSVYITRQGELWFGGENHDRMDLLPEKKSYQPGETARFQVRMPFRFATALLTVEREGVIQSQVVQLNGQEPTVEVKIKDGWGPNVFVSVLALRGRLRDVPWYSFFTWGYQAPREWWTSFWVEGREYVAPTALVDLSKPAFRLGVAEIRVGIAAHQLDVSVKADKESYPVRGQAKVTLTVKRPNGQPAAGAEVALVAVDQALLELMPNTSWNLLEAMLQRRAWGVETATAHMEIIGRRHYGRKAVPAGGGGGRSGTRELLDTLLLWNPRVQLDAQGQATVTVPLNDALTTFKIVAVADAGTSLFGTGDTTIRTTQDLQIIAGLAPLVREDDQYRAQFTLRNTTPKAMKVAVTPRTTLLELKAQTVDIPAGEAREVAWEVTTPAQLTQTRAEAILWEIEAKDTVSGARDALKVRQRIIPRVPLTVQQATLVQLDGPFSLPVAAPADALPGRGGLKLSLKPTLSDGLPGVRDWFANYPFACLEQKASQAIGLRDVARWQSVTRQLPGYLDSDGLANYFPPLSGEANRGSDTLTAYLLASSHEASQLNNAFALSEAVREPMARGLIAFVEGRIQREFWSPRKDLDVRKLAALEALSRYGKAQGRMLASITLSPHQWPTHAVIDWLNILQRVPDAPERDKRMIEANQILKSRISTQGTQLVFSTEKDDYWWWLMQNGDVNAARLMLAVMNNPAWKDDMGRLATGLLGRQSKGAWRTTTANLWGSLAVEKFATKFYAAAVTGSTQATSRGGSARADWQKTGAAPDLFLPWAAPAQPDSLSITHMGTGKPWLTVQSLAAIDLKAPFSAGYQIKKTITPMEQANKNLPAGSYTRGDVLRITLEITASADMSWAVITDPVPSGASILGSGLGRDSEIATQGEKAASEGWPAFEERSFEAWRGYYAYLPKGVTRVQYTLRLNTVGEFSLPPSRAEAMYAPEMFGESPNGRIKVLAVK